MSKVESFIKEINDKGVYTIHISESFWGKNIMTIGVKKNGHYWTEGFTYSKGELETQWDSIEREIRGRCEVVFNEAM
jgi:hypothetical protein